MEYILLGLILGLIFLLVYIKNKYKICEGHGHTGSSIEEHPNQTGIPLITYIPQSISSDNNIQKWTDILSETSVSLCSQDRNNENCIKLCKFRNNSDNILKSNCDDNQYCSSPIGSPHLTGRINKSEMINDNVGICKEFDRKYIKTCPDNYEYKISDSNIYEYEIESDVYRE